ncbi:MAG: polysaccharide deacetylase family protein [Chthonomonadales bacterium]
MRKSGLVFGVLLCSSLLFGCPRKQAPAASVPGIPVSTTPPPPTYDDISVRCQNARVPVIMYHDIIKKRGAKSAWFDCTVTEFTSAIDKLKADGASFVSLDDLYKHLNTGFALPAKSVVLTFDDNYQGFYDNAYPILKQQKIPSVMFVHTNFVGTGGDHPKMKWETVKALDKEGLCTIGSHTLSHPDNLKNLPATDQTRELSESKSLIEKQLGHPVKYLAYPNGSNGDVTQQIAKTAGYLMAFTIENGPAEESPNILAVNRYVHTRVDKAWADCRKAETDVPAAVYEAKVNASPVHLEMGEYAGVKMGLTRGGAPVTVHSPGRQSVGEFIDGLKGVAGINGTFFADAHVNGTDNHLIGPAQTADGYFVGDDAPERLPRLVNRPIIMWGPDKVAIFPFQPGTMNRAEAIKNFMPDFTDVFLAGAWLVHGGVARTRDQMEAQAASDSEETRRRAFFGVDVTGQFVAGATLEVVSTSKMAEAAAAAGVQEAVLLDSGFSTSLIYDNKIIVTGHTSTEIPSRPVPHAIVLKGTVAPSEDPAVIEFLKTADLASGPGSIKPSVESGDPPPRRRRSRRNRRRKSEDTTAPTDNPTRVPGPDMTPLQKPDQPIPP